MEKLAEAVEEAMGAAKASKESTENAVVEAESAGQLEPKDAPPAMVELQPAVDSEPIEQKTEAEAAPPVSLEAATGQAADAAPAVEPPAEAAPAPVALAIALSSGRSADGARKVTFQAPTIAEEDRQHVEPPKAARPLAVPPLAIPALCVWTSVPAEGSLLLEPETTAESAAAISGAEVKAVGTAEDAVLTASNKAGGDGSYDSTISSFASELAAHDAADADVPCALDGERQSSLDLAAEIMAGALRLAGKADIIGLRK